MCHLPHFVATFQALELVQDCDDVLIGMLAVTNCFALNEAVHRSRFDASSQYFSGRVQCVA